MTIHLIAADVFAAARRAYADGTLQAVGAPDIHCRYAGPCGIGAALDVKTASYLDTLSATINDLIDTDEVTTDNPGALIWLQRAHDSLSQLNSGSEYVPMQVLGSKFDAWDEHISKAQADAAFREIMGAL